MPLDGLPRSQKNLFITINHSLVKDAVVMRIEGEEGISELFRFDVFLQTNNDIDINKIINTTATIKIELEEQKKAFYSGIIEKASFENIPSTISTKTDNILYIRISPTLCKAKYNVRYRTFQEKTAQEILKSVLKENGVSNLKMDLRSAGKKSREFCVQYGESDFHFISRLMEEEGIFYYFEFDDEKDTLVLSDSSISAKVFQTELKIRKHSTNATLTSDSLYNVSFSTEIGIEKVNSFSYNVSKATVVSGESSDSKEKYKIGSREIFDPVFLDKSSGDSVAKISLECDNATLKTLQGYSYNPYILSGNIIKISGSRSNFHNGNFFIISMKHFINQISDDQNAPVYHNSFVAIPSNVSFRSSNRHLKNRIYGCQTATVTGTSGEEIYCNEHGSIKLKFHWDSRTKADEKSSCWVRVSQDWAGKSFGQVITPRVGMEVLVEFVNGDPDQPLVVGCLYNGINKPPENYPSNRKTASTFYTKSYKAQGFNELRFDDKTDAEEIFIHAQKDFNYTIENNRTGIINEGSNKLTLESKKDPVENVLLIKKGSNKITIHEGNYVVVLDKGNQSITLKEGNQNIKLSKGNLDVNITGNITIKASENIKIEANGTIDMISQKAMSFDSKDSISTKAAQDFSLSCSNSSQSAKQKYSVSCINYSTKANANLEISGMTAKLSATTSLNISSNASANISATAMMNISGTATLALKGGMIKLN